MQWMHLKSADLNLLLALHILIEERQVKRAADRFGLSPPAMSRVLQRLRQTFNDELLIRTGEGYQPTPRAQRIHTELSDVLWRVETLLRGDDFDPHTALDTFTISSSDFSTFIQGPALTSLLRKQAPNVSLEIVSFTDDTFSDIKRGKTDLALWVEDVPPPLVSEPLFVEDYVCVVAKGHPALGRAMTLDDYLQFSHVVVTILSGSQIFLDSRIEKLGGKREARLKVPYFAAAVAAVPHTDLIATVPRRFAVQQAEADLVEIVPAPAGIEPLQYLMAWHPRLTNDPAHAWLRSIVRDSAAEL